MLHVLSRKASDAKLDDKVTTLHARPYEVKEKLRQQGITVIDGGYSTYGAINTDPFLPQLFRDLASMIRPGGDFVIGVWNKYCLSEILGYALRTRPNMIVARMRNPVPVGKSRFCIASNAYTVGTMRSLMDGIFKLKEVRGVEIFLPPSNLVRYLPPGPLGAALKKLDTSIEAHYPWNRLGDHFLAVCERV
jgi:hypothetical protein